MKYSLLQNLIFILLLALSFNCNSETTNNNNTSMIDTNKARQILEEHYQTSFKINSTKHSRHKGVDVAYGQLKNNPEVKFHATFKPSDHTLINDSYVRQLWSFNLKERIEKKLNQQVDKFVINVNIYTDLAQEADPTNLPSFDEMVTQVDDLESAITIYLFKDISSEDFQLIQDLVEYVETLDPQKNHFQYSFYDKDFFKNKDLEEYEYGFQKLQKGFFEMDYKDYLRKRLIFSLKKDSAVPTLEQLKEAVDENPNIFGTKPTYF